MTKPFADRDPMDLWHEVYVGAANASPSVRACVGAAFRQADQVWRQVVGDPTLDAQSRSRLTGDAQWARTALAAFQDLRNSGAYSHLDIPNQLRCWADRNTLRAWLVAPSRLPGFVHLSVAESWGIAEDFDWQDEEVANRMATLVEQAQAEGVYGVAGYTITLRHLTSDDPAGHADPIIEHQVTLATPSGAVLASAAMATDHLAEDDLSGVDAALAALINIAAAVNELLVDEFRIVASGWNTPTPEHQPTLSATSGPSRGFGPLDLAATANTPVAIEPPTPPRPDRRPHR
jgi:hypothetical protein